LPPQPQPEYEYIRGLHSCLWFWMGNTFGLQSGWRVDCGGVHWASGRWAPFFQILFGFGKFWIGSDFVCCIHLLGICWFISVGSSALTRSPPLYPECFPMSSL
jgi:hypothetical protein